MSIWIMSANAGYFNHECAFAEQGYIDWKQTRNYEIEDLVLIYSTKPEGRIKYLTKVIATNIQEDDITDQSKYWKKPLLPSIGKTRYCRLELLDNINDKELSFSELQKYGMNYAPQSPCKVKEPLLTYISSKVRIEKWGKS